MTQHIFLKQLAVGDPSKPVVYAAQWLLPHQDSEDRFQISEGEVLTSA